MKKCLILIVLALLLVPCVVRAEQKADVSFSLSEEETPTATLQGALSGKRSVYTAVTVELLKCGAPEATPEETYEKAKELFYAKQQGEDLTAVLDLYQTVMTDISGAYTVSYPQRTESGVYALRIFTEYDPNPSYYIYTYTDPTELKLLLTQLNVADMAGLKTLIDENAYKLNIDTDIYKTLIADKTCALLLKLRGNQFESMNDFGGKFKTAVILEQLSEAEDAQTIKTVVEKNDALFGIQTVGFYPTFVKLISATQEAVYAELAKADYDTVQSVQKAFCEKGFLMANAKTNYWSEMRSLITNNAQWLELDMSKYEKSEENAQRADKALVKMTFNTVEDWKKAFYDALDKSDEPNKTVSSGKGSGGGTGGTSLSPITVEAQPETAQGEPEKDSFADMAGHAWAKQAVNVLAEKKVINGYDDGSFLPDGIVTRGEFIKMVASAFGFVKNGARCDFEDVPRDSWQYLYVASAYRVGIINGKEEAIFGAEDSITREEIAAILERSAAQKGQKLPKLNEKQEFADAVEIHEYALSAVGGMQQAGVITGYADGSFKPEAAATRAEAAVMIYRLYKILEVAA